MRPLVRFLTQNAVGRQITFMVHRGPLHPGWTHPMRFASGGCWLCDHVVGEFLHDVSEGFVPDGSSIAVCDPEFNEDGSIKRRGMTMTATAKRQLDAILAEDPEAYAELQKTLDEIVKNP